LRGLLILPRITSAALRGGFFFASNEGATVLEGLDADHALLAEIDENLVRADLSPAESALHTAKRKEIYERIHPETKAGVAGGRPKKTSDKMSQVSPPGFTKATAKATGKTTKTVERAASRGKHISVLSQVIGTSLDKGEELDALAKLPKASQQALADRAQAGEKVSAKTPATAARNLRKLRRFLHASRQPDPLGDMRGPLLHR
jgi:hypothetical protein